MSTATIIVLVIAGLLLLACFVFIGLALFGVIDRGYKASKKTLSSPVLHLSYFELITLRRVIENDWIDRPAGPTRDNLMSILDKINVELSK